MQSLLSPVDAEVLTGDLARWLAETHQVALAAGDQGWWDDGAAHLTSWGFDLRDIRVPVKIWHGREDRFVPRSTASGWPPASLARRPISATATATSP